MPTQLANKPMQVNKTDNTITATGCGMNCQTITFDKGYDKIWRMRQFTSEGVLIPGWSYEDVQTYLNTLW